MCLPLGPVCLWGFRMYEAHEFPTIFVFKCHIFHLIITSILIGMNSGSSVNHFNTLSPSEVMGTNTYNLFIFLHPEQLSVRSGKEKHTSETQWLPTCEGSDLTILYNSTIIQIYMLKTKPASQYSVLVCAQNISIKSLIRKKKQGPVKWLNRCLLQFYLRACMVERENQLLQAAPGLHSHAVLCK